MVTADGATAVVLAIHAVAGIATMDDLTVSTLHTFAVGTGQFVVHNCGQVEYGKSGTLSERVRNRRIFLHDRGGNYAAAELDDGSVIFGRSSGKIHAEEDLLNQIEDRGRIRALYSEYEPCAAKCAANVQGIPNVSWTWRWNGNNPEETEGIRAASRIAKMLAMKALRW